MNSLDFEEFKKKLNKIYENDKGKSIILLEWTKVLMDNNFLPKLATFTNEIKILKNKLASSKEEKKKNKKDE